MRKIKFTKEEKDDLIRDFMNEIEKYEDDVVTNALKFEKKFIEKVPEKITVFFSPSAYIKCQALVKTYTGEVGWHATIFKLKQNEYIVKDVFVYPQDAGGARVLDPTTNNDWYEQLDRKGDYIDHLQYQAHSHVNFSTSPSKTDLDNQAQIIKNMNSEGFYLFQIWNKAGDINSFLYDLDNNILYDRDNIEIRILFKDGTLDEFIEDSHNYVRDVRYEITTSSTVNTKKEEKKEEEKEEKYLTFEEAKKEMNYEYKWGTHIKDPFYWNDGIEEGFGLQ